MMVSIFLYGLFLIALNNNQIIYNHENVKIFPSIEQEYKEVKELKKLTFLNVASFNIRNNYRVLLFDIEIEFFNVPKEKMTKDAGDFVRIHILNTKSKQELVFDNLGGWEKAYGPISKYLTNDYFLEINIGGSESVLILFGCTYNSQPGWLTIISLQGPKPEIIFNQEVSLIKIVKNGKSHKLIIDYDFWERGDDNGASTRLRASADAYKSCREIYIENNELKVVPCTRTLADDKREELEENKKTNQVK